MFNIIIFHGDETENHKFKKWTDSTRSRQGRWTVNLSHCWWEFNFVIPFWKNIWQWVVVQSLSRVWLFATPWTSVRPASLSFTISLSLLKFTSTESVMLSIHLILCHPLLLLPSIFPSFRVCSNESALCIRWSKTGASASISVLPMNIRSWFPLGTTGTFSPVLQKLSLRPHQPVSNKGHTTVSLNQVLIIGGDVDWYNHYGEEQGTSFKN